MPTYRVTGVVTGSKYLGEFEADTPEEAEEMALNSNAASVLLCHQCSDECEDPEIHTTDVTPVEPDPPKKPPKKNSKKSS